jgi:hypothetical protein
MDQVAKLQMMIQTEEELQQQEKGVSENGISLGESEFSVFSAS